MELCATITRKSLQLANSESLTRHQKGKYPRFPVNCLPVGGVGVSLLLSQDFFCRLEMQFRHVAKCLFPVRLDVSASDLHNLCIRSLWEGNAVLLLGILMPAQECVPRQNRSGGNRNVLFSLRDLDEFYSAPQLFQPGVNVLFVRELVGNSKLPKYTLNCALLPPCRTLNCRP